MKGNTSQTRWQRIAMLTDCDIWGFVEKQFRKKLQYNVQDLYRSINKDYKFDEGCYPIEGVPSGELSMTAKLEILQNIGEHRKSSDLSITVAVAMIASTVSLSVAYQISEQIFIGIVIQLVLLAGLFVLRSIKEDRANKLLEAIYILQQMDKAKISLK